SGDEADEAEDQNQDERSETAKCSGQPQYRPVGKSDDGPHGFPLMSSCCCLRGRWGPHPPPRPATTSSTNMWTTRPPARGVRTRRNSATTSRNVRPHRSPTPTSTLPPRTATPRTWPPGTGVVSVPKLPTESSTTSGKRVASRTITSAISPGASVPAVTTGPLAPSRLHRLRPRHRVDGCRPH